MVYEDIFDAKNACEHLSGFNVCNRYLVVLYYQPHKVRACDLLVDVEIVHACIIIIVHALAIIYNIIHNYIDYFNYS